MRVVEIWVRGGRRSKARAIREAGYGESVARQPEKVFGSPAVQDELEKRGFGRYGYGDGTVPVAEIELIVPAKPIPTFDISKMGKESLQNLKDRLEAASGAPLRLRPQPEEEDTSYVSTGSGDIFNETAGTQKFGENSPSLSSM